MTLYKEIATTGYDWRDVVEELECSRQELERWQEDGKFPPPDGLVLTHTFTSMSRAYDHMGDGWLPETIEKVKPHNEQWRAEHQVALKAKQKERRKRRKVVDLLKAGL